MKHLLSIESLSAEEILQLLDSASELKASRGRHAEQPLAGQIWALIFSKSSTRTRVSFEVGIRELGGSVMFLSAADIQLGRGEPIKDTARVMGRMLNGAVIRTYAQADVEDFATYSGIPTINALTDDEHPCQILADLQTIRERFGPDLKNRSVAFIGDGACNVAASWIWAAARLGFHLRIASPSAFLPAKELIARVNAPNVVLTEDVMSAAKGADVLYTDVWVSMGKESEAAYRLSQFGLYKIDQEAVAVANPGALVMHCLPAYRGKEITDDTFEAHAQTIFDQAENRLHAQKAVLAAIAASKA